MDQERILFFNNLWKELHLKALDVVVGDENLENDLKVIREWSSKIPRFTTGCACKEFWTNWTKANPYRIPFRPDFPIKIDGENSLPNLFAWSVVAHNAVNQKLGKPQMSFRDAYLHWKEVKEKGI